jgi:hypothetical protein
MTQWEKYRLWHLSTCCAYLATILKLLKLQFTHL